MNGEVAAYLIRWHDPFYRGRATVSRDPCHEDHGSSEPLVSATDYAALQEKLESSRETNAALVRGRCQMDDEIAALQAKLDAVTKERDALREKVLSAIPSNWCDPLLTGDGSALGKAPWGCPEIERLLLGIRERIAALTDQGRAGEAT